MRGNPDTSAGGYASHRRSTGPLRVAFCIDNMNMGGTELNAVRTAERLDRSRYDLRAICLQSEGPLIERYRAAGIPVIPFPIASLYAAGTLRQGLRLARYLREERIDIFHAHDIYSNVFGGPWARLAGARVIASRRWWEGFPGLPWRLATRAAYRCAHAVLANSAGVAVMVRDVERVPAERVTVVPNFVDEHACEIPSPAERRAMRERLGVDDADTVVGIIANLLPVKDHASLLRATTSLAPRWRGLRLVLVGDGAQRAAGMGERGRRRARELYSPEAALSALENLYQRLVSRNHSTAGVN